MYKIAILGCENSHAKNFLDLISKGLYPEIEVIGVYSNEPETSEKLKEKFGVAVLSDYLDAVGNVDGIMITACHGDNHYKDSAVFMARLDNGASVMADVSYSAPSQAFTMPSYWEFRFWCEKGMLTFCYTDSDVTIYKDGDREPIRVCGIPTQENWMTDLIARIENGDRGFTENTLRSCKTALSIQAAADRSKS